MLIAKLMATPNDLRVKICVAVAKTYPIAYVVLAITNKLAKSKTI